MKNNILVILGAGKPKGNQSVAALTVDKITNSTLLDWQLSLAQRYFDRIIFVTGYKNQELKQKNPNLEYVFNEDWKLTGPIGSLKLVNINKNHNYCIMYSDLLVFK